ncbi:phosphatidate cytidylyltransferase [Lignipirellula cremea]|uniref:Phosphatidate cytidylyltransferase n=1 Tax=Lignipirellula cremea TaxID=2528010 RepID=A0A518DZI1_9BACT|nr:phosphatidate cytidylyltransferase [Lignipirellula cremea]QDU97242.1 Phosphatidate cytidylyltransferase [Lignipirellula cremea]
MLRWRLLSAISILAVLFTLLWLDYAWNFGWPSLWLLPVLILLAVGGAWETLDLLAAGGLRPARIPTCIGTLLTATAGMVPLCMEMCWKPYPPDCPVGRLGWPVLALAFGAALALASEMRRYQEPTGRAVTNAAASIFVMTYIGLLLGFLAPLRLLHSNGVGMAAVLSMAVVVKFSDVGAYTFGRLLGRTKLSPRLSPGKTVEGAIGGALTACLVSWVFFTYAMPQLTGRPAPAWWASIVFGLVMTASGIFGDLAESMLKRDMQRKDSSNWLPGLGGVLDVIDSILFSAPAAYLCWVAGIFGPV